MCTDEELHKQKEDREKPVGRCKKWTETIKRLQAEGGSRKNAYRYTHTHTWKREKSAAKPLRKWTKVETYNSETEGNKQSEALV